jgi:hypothetical protein
MSLKRGHYDSTVPAEVENGVINRLRPRKQANPAIRAALVQSAFYVPF